MPPFLDAAEANQSTRYLTNLLPITKNLILFYSLALIASGIILIHNLMVTSQEKILEVVFPFSVLRPEATLFDAENTDSTFQYYLFENLSLGLIRDDPNTQGGYRGGLASHWQQTSPSSWTFKIRPTLKWSDGHPITGDQLTNHFESLKKGHHRHLVQLKDFQTVIFDKTLSTLTFTFTHPVNETFLREISLADAALTHASNITDNWTVTSGPYSVETLDLKQKSITLRLNKFCPIISKNSVERVHLFGLNKVEQIDSVFKSIPADLFYLSPPNFRKIYDQVKKSAPQVIHSEFTLIYFLYFSNNLVSESQLETRQLIRSLFWSYFKTIKTDTISFYDQMIPKGYKGSIGKLDLSPINAKKLSHNRITINLHPALAELLTDQTNFREFISKNGIDAVIEHNAFPGDKKNKPSDVTMTVFQGNQKESLGSWSFLFSEPFGVLSPFNKHFKKYMHPTQTTFRSTDTSLTELHRDVLDKAYAIPFLRERNTVLGSERIDFSNWNPFDLRLRFYELSWK